VHSTQQLIISYVKSLDTTTKAILRDKEEAGGPLGRTFYRAI